MEIFLKQQIIESIKTIIKARWFYLAAISAQAVLVKVFFPGIPLPSSLIIAFVMVAVLLFNFFFFLYLRRPMDKIGDKFLNLIKLSQVPLEQIGLFAGLYYSGTANKMMMMLSIIPIMVGSNLYKVRGIIAATFSTMIFYSGLVIMEYYALLPAISPEAAAYSPSKVLIGNANLSTGQLIGFNLYIIAAAFYAGYLADLHKRRENRLVNQKNELSVKTNLLSHQTTELTKTKDQLEDALVKSDAAKKSAVQARDETGRINLQLKSKVDELEKFYKITMGRELKMVELKEKIKGLEEKTKKKS